MRRLLGAACPADPLDADAVLALPEIPGKRDAIARLGGPFARFTPFTTLEETLQQLCRVIVGAPADGSPFDVNVRFTLHRGPAPQVATVRHAQTTMAHVIDAPFAFDGVMRAQRCEAEVTLTWRGVSWTEHFAGPQLFPTITSWQAVAFPAATAPALEAVLTADGAVNPALDWRAYVQIVEAIPALDEPHAVHLIRDYEEPLKAKAPLVVGYIATTIISPDAREAVLEFRAGGAATLLCNGAPLEVLSNPAAEDAPLWSRPNERTTPFALGAGENTLLIQTTPAPDAHPYWWFFGARLTTPDGVPMVDMEYK